MKKHQVLVLFMIILLVATVSVGCGAANALDRAEDKLEDRAARAEDAMEKALQGSIAAAQTLTREEAEAIALKAAGLTQTEVAGLHSEYDIEDGVPEWEVDFRSGAWEYEYTIHAETGAIRHSERERWD